jgi:hypothetical protein
MKHHNHDISETEFGASIGISLLLTDKAEIPQLTDYCNHKLQHNSLFKLKNNTLSLLIQKTINWHFHIQCFCKAPKNLLSKITAQKSRRKK